MRLFLVLLVVLLAANRVDRSLIVFGRRSRSIIVGSNVTNEYASIQEAINTADPGDIINVKSGIYYENLVINKSIALFGEDRESTIIDGGGNGDVAFVEAENVTLQGFTLRNSGTGSFNPFGGVVLNSSHGCLVSNNTIVGNEFGVWFSNSDNNTFVNNIVANSSGTYGVRLYESRNNVLAYNYVVGNAYGIYLYSSSNGNVVKYNNISRCSFGLCLATSEGNTVEGNSVTESLMYGITLRLSGGNSVFHNNFFSNYFQADTSEALDNVWDDGYPSGGNYWSDYGGPDESRGIDQNVSGSDGLGDTAYGYKVGNMDRYPLMGFFSVFDVVWNGTYHSVFAICNSSVTGFSFTTEEGVEMHLNVSGDWGTQGFCRISLPKVLLQNGEYKVIVNGDYLLPASQLESDDAYDVLYFEYVHGPLIHEFSALFLMLLLLCLTLVFLAEKIPRPHLSVDVSKRCACISFCS